MREQIDQSASEAWALVARQHGVIARRQLLALGFSSSAIARRIASGRLHVIWPGVYAVGRPELRRLGQLMAAVLACGDDAVLSHASAAELWELGLIRDGVIHVSVRETARRRLPGIEVHRRRSLTADHVSEHRGIPVTDPVQTLIDIATQLSTAELEAAVNEADKCELLDPEELRTAVSERGPLAGTRKLARVLDRHTFTLTDSELERRFLPIARRAGLAKPQTQVYVNGFRVDFYWPALPLIVETDGLRYHRTAAQQARDRLRDQTHAAAGITTLRFTHAQIRYRPEAVEHVLAAVSERLVNSLPHSGSKSTNRATSAGSSGLRRLRAASAGRPSR